MDISQKLHKRIIHNRQRSQAVVERAKKSPLLNDIKAYSNHQERRSGQFEKDIPGSNYSSQMRQRIIKKVSAIPQNIEGNFRT